MRFLAKSFSLLLLLLIAGCATIVKGGKQSVTVNVVGAEGADVSISEIVGDKENVLSTGKSGLNYTLKKGSGFFKRARYKVKAKQSGQKVEKILSPTPNWIYYLGGNIVMAGPLTGAIGYLIVDPWTGAMWKFNLDKDDQINLDFAKEATEDTERCDFFNQTVTLKNKEVLQNVVFGIIPNYIVIFTKEGKTWVYPKSEVQGAENSSLPQDNSSTNTEKLTCNFFTQTITLKKGDVFENIFSAITPQFIVILKSDGKILVYPKSEVLNIKNK